MTDPTPHDPLDDVRRALGLPPASQSSSQEAGAGAAASTQFDAAAAQFEARAKAHEAERAKLAAAGDDADGLYELRQAFKRAGRG